MMAALGLGTTAWGGRRPSVSTERESKLRRDQIVADLREEMGKGDKMAILMVHFGSAYAEAREALGRMNREVREAFPGVETREAYSARSVVNRVRRQGIWIEHTTDALITLKKEGFTHVVVQPTIVIEGLEMEALRREVEQRKGLFKEIRVGDPLLYSDADYETVIRAITGSDVNARQGAKLLVANGTYHASNAAYAKLGYMCQLSGHPDYMIGTREGFPTLETVIGQLRQGGYRQVTLIPFMFVLIKSKENRVATAWREGLEKAGLKVDLYAKGLGDYPAIRRLIIDHVRAAIAYRRVSVSERKEMFSRF